VLYVKRKCHWWSKNETWHCEMWKYVFHMNFIDKQRRLWRNWKIKICHTLLLFWAFTGSERGNQIEFQILKMFYEVDIRYCRAAAYQRRYRCTPYSFIRNSSIKCIHNRRLLNKFVRFTVTMCTGDRHSFSLLLLLLFTAIELSLAGSSPYTSTDTTNKNKYT